MAEAPFIGRIWLHQRLQNILLISSLQWACSRDFDLCSFIYDYVNYHGMSRAAYKGYPDCVRLLLFMDADRSRQDKEGMFFVPVYPSLAFIRELASNRIEKN